MNLLITVSPNKYQTKKRILIMMKTFLKDKWWNKLKNLLSKRTPSINYSEQIFCDPLFAPTLKNKNPPKLCTQTIDFLLLWLFWGSSALVEVFSSSFNLIYFMESYSVIMQIPWASENSLFFRHCLGGLIWRGPVFLKPLVLDKYLLKYFSFICDDIQKCNLGITCFHSKLYSWVDVILLLTPTYPNAVLSGLRIVALYIVYCSTILQKRLLKLLIFNQGIPIPVPYSKRLYLKISR